MSLYLVPVWGGGPWILATGWRFEVPASWFQVTCRMLTLLGLTTSSVCVLIAHYPTCPTYPTYPSYPCYPSYPTHPAIYPPNYPAIQLSSHISRPFGSDHRRTLEQHNQKAQQSAAATWRHFA
ncbi:GD15933 [Drosophila simulans]|uniref:GD15933 n=1 Tax=Drosophila simulans TaxID=7240 RepID=B4R3N4_DROSI|nr:GD15933 [Drosophila simulans]